MIHLKYGDLCLKHDTKYFTKYIPYQYYLDWYGTGLSKYQSAPRNLEDWRPQAGDDDLSISAKDGVDTIRKVILRGRPDVRYTLWLNDHEYLEYVDLSNNKLYVEDFTLRRGLPNLKKVDVTGVDELTKNFLLDELNHNDEYHFIKSGNYLVKDNSFTPIDSGTYNPLIVDASNGTSVHKVHVFDKTNGSYFTYFNRGLVFKRTSGSTYQQYIVVYVPETCNATLKLALGTLSTGNDPILDPVAKVYESKPIQQIVNEHSTSSFTLLNRPSDTITVGGITYKAVCFNFGFNNTNQIYYACASVSIVVESDKDERINILC